MMTSEIMACKNTKFRSIELRVVWPFFVLACLFPRVYTRRATVLDIYPYVLCFVLCTVLCVGSTFYGQYIQLLAVTVMESLRPPRDEVNSKYLIVSRLVELGATGCWQGNSKDCTEIRCCAVL